MTTALIGNIGERLDLLIRQGGTFGPYKFKMQQPKSGAVPLSDGTYAPTDLDPIDLTGAVIRGQIRRTPADTAIVADVLVVITDAAAGEYEISLTDEVTAGIVAGVDLSKRESQYVWDLELEDTLGRVLPLYWGAVKVFREVTRV